jgi:hypothetical protein
VSLVRDTPIYDQLRVDSIHAEVRAQGVDRQRVGHLGQHRLTAAALGEPPVFGRRSVRS